ncbi:hypothetical protein BJY01DRAFT_250520 [Aspergillus pseudoustus]|uniref:BZIP domain-containing protein n=1 Tax=Aspergillus pseudoustus TaxID=1810923 RepID=A0ABR4JH20_9EURO
METEQLYNLNWSLTTTDPRDPVLPWEFGFPSPPPQRPGPEQQGDNGGAAAMWADPELDLLLSASSYPMPEPVQLPEMQGFEQNEPLQLFGGVLLDNSGYPDEIAEAADASALSGPNGRPKRSTKTTATATGDAVRKRGRPRKVFADGGINPEERRRMQVRMAQRAYRSRKEANVGLLKDRINQLETAVKQMSTAVISFGDELVRSGALDSHPDLLRPLGNTVQACLALPAIPQLDGDADSQLELPDGSMQRKLLPIYPSPSSSGSESSDTMDILEFIDRLHVTCSYQAYLVCANPAVPLRRLEKPFRMLLSLMPRAFVAEYFKDWLLARAGHKTLDHWDHIPFFQIGGAGTHYKTKTGGYYPFHRSQKPSRVTDDLSQFPSDIREQLDDEWFDLGDLEGYLREREIVFPAYIPAVTSVGLGEKSPSPNSASRLISALVRCAICLGRSPGFRKCDVETAVDEFQASMANSDSS